MSLEMGGVHRIVFSWPCKLTEHPADFSTKRLEGEWGWKERVERKKTLKNVEVLSSRTNREGGISVKGL